MNALSLPNKVLLALNEAQQYRYAQDYGKAHKILSELCLRYPQEGHLHLALGELYLEVEEFDRAISCFSQACHLLPTHYPAIFSLLEAFESVNAHQDVSKLNDFMLAHFSHSPEVLYKSAHYYSEIGRLREAINYCNKCIEKCVALPNRGLLQAYAYLLLIKIDPTVHSRNTLTLLGAILVQLKTKDDAEVPAILSESMLLHYCMGEIHHQLGEAKNAFDHWLVANSIQRTFANFHTADMASFFAQLQSVHAQPFILPLTMQAQPVTGPTPIFIVSLPRTGSTLLETMLCQHSCIDTVGESTIVSQQLARFFEQHLAKPYPLFMPELNQDNQENKHLIEQAQAIYRHAISKRQLSKPYIIDKLPANFQSIGLIKRLFPHAKIIHITRDMNDVALSIFRHHFASNEPYFCDIQELAMYHDFYQNIMDMWDRNFGDQLYTLKYEDLVTCPQAKIADVLTYCGLAYEDACEYAAGTSSANSAEHTFVKPIKTLSATEARSPVSSNSVGNAKPYTDLLNFSLKRTTN